VREKSDERILGSGEFVEQLIRQSDQSRKEHFSAFQLSQKASALVGQVCKEQNIRVDTLKSGSRRRNVSMVRAQLAQKLVEGLGLSLAETGRHIGVSPSAVAKSLSRLDKNKFN
jgi:chromosomal replication initiation ATPase DnaA